MSVVDPVSSKLASLADDIADAAEEGTVTAMSVVVEEAKARAPEVTGALKRSGRAVNEDGAGVAEFTVQYALNVHENPESEGYRFLESAFDDVARAIPDIVAKEIKGEL